MSYRCNGGIQLHIRISPGQLTAAIIPGGRRRVTIPLYPLQPTTKLHRYVVREVRQPDYTQHMRLCSLCCSGGATNVLTVRDLLPCSMLEPRGPDYYYSGAGAQKNPESRMMWRRAGRRGRRSCLSVSRIAQCGNSAPRLQSTGHWGQVLSPGSDPLFLFSPFLRGGWNVQWMDFLSWAIGVRARLMPCHDIVHTTFLLSPNRKPIRASRTDSSSSSPLFFAA